MGARPRQLECLTAKARAGRAPPRIDWLSFCVSQCAAETMVKVDVGPCPTGLLEVTNAVREYTIVDLEAADKAYGEFSLLSTSCLTTYSI